MDRCDKCGGFIFTDKDSIRCMNCGKRFYQLDCFSTIYLVHCKKCGKEIYSPNRSIRVCDDCKKKLYRKKRICSSCGEEFIAKSSRTTKCKKCRTHNRNEEYIKKNKILSYNLKKMRESRYENIKNKQAC